MQSARQQLLLERSSTLEWNVCNVYLGVFFERLTQHVHGRAWASGAVVVLQRRVGTQQGDQHLVQGHTGGFGVGGNLAGGVAGLDHHAARVV